MILFGWTAILQADESFISIHAVSGNRIQISPASGGRGMRGGGQPNQDANTNQTGPPGRRGRGRMQGGVQLTSVVIPATTKVTNAMRERRTFEFRVMGEIAGGLRNPIFRQMKQPLQARIVTRNKVITEINVVTGETDINQTATSNGQSVIAVKPKRPPMKRR